ncbi:MAG: hypothetical protein SGJ18_00330 [Pseudomonadota bacterium]|nr:hypothetical protein [Pseudomonadota bacterium]
MSADKLIFLGCFFLISCVGVPSEWEMDWSFAEYGSHVKVAETVEELSSCEFVGNVKVEVSVFQFEDEKVKDGVASKALRTAAGRAGANVVVKTGSSATTFWRFPILEGKGFRCPIEIRKKYSY